MYDDEEVERREVWGKVALLAVIALGAVVLCGVLLAGVRMAVVVAAMRGDL